MVATDLACTVCSGPIKESLGRFANKELADYAAYALREAQKGNPYDLHILAELDRYPVGIDTFVQSEDYLAMAESIYPKVLDALVELNNPPVDGLPHGLRVGSTYTEAVLTGAIGVAKSTIAQITTAYQLYVLSCLKNPQRLFDLDRSSEIVFIFQSINARLARQVDYDRFKAMLEISPYFREHFPFDAAIKSELRFPKRIIVRPVTGLDTATLGQNVFGGALDEVNYMEVVSRSSKSVEGDVYDQAISLYNSIARRRKSRFLKQGRLPGVLCLVSSRRYPGQFTDIKEAEASRELQKEGATSIYIYDKRTWDIKPEGTFSGEWFQVFQGDETRQPRIVESRDELVPDDHGLVIEVPLEYRTEFESDIMKALRDIAGVSTLALSPFILGVDSVAECFGMRQSLISREVVDFEGISLQIYPSRITDPEKPRWIHVDLALTGDSAGVVMGYVPCFTSVKRGNEVETLPMIHIDFALEVKPPKGGEIQIWKIRELIYKCRELGVNVRWVSFDGFQSADSIQTLRQKGFQTGLQSVDRTDTPYQLTKMALYDDRIKIPTHRKLLSELLGLERDSKTGKIDHRPGSSKDVSDALAGVVYGLTMRREIWASYGVSPIHVPPILKKLAQKDGFV